MGYSTKIARLSGNGHNNDHLAAKPKKRVTLAAINDQMEAEGMKATLYKGRGYFYLMGPVSASFESIYTYALKQMTFAQWMDAVRDSYYKATR